MKWITPDDTFNTKKERVVSFDEKRIMGKERDKEKTCCCGETINTLPKVERGTRVITGRFKEKVCGDFLSHLKVGGKTIFNEGT